MHSVCPERLMRVLQVVIEVHHAGCPEVLLILYLDLPRIGADFVLVAKDQHSLKVHGLRRKGVQRCCACAAKADVANLLGDSSLRPHVAHSDADGTDLPGTGHGLRVGRTKRLRAG